MRTAFVFPLLFFLCFSVPGDDQEYSEDSEKAETIRLLNINLRHGQKPNNESNISEAVSVINSIRPDIAAVQEVDRGVRRSSKKDQPALLAGATGMHPSFSVTIPSYHGGEYGLLLLSRKPVSSIQTRTLPHLPGEEKRIIQESVITLDSGLTVLIFHTHLGHKAPESLTLQQITTIKNWAGGRKYDALFLMGDLNFGRSGPAYRLIAEDFIDPTPEGIRGTYPAENPTIQLDYILFKSNLHAAVTAFDVVEDPLISDHLPIWIDIEFHNNW